MLGVIGYAERLDPDAEPFGNLTDFSAAVLPLSDRCAAHPDRPLTKLLERDYPS